MSKNAIGYGTGRRKCAIARVWLESGEGLITVNGQDFKDYFGRPVLEIMVKSPFPIINGEGKFNVRAKVTGGGKTGQAGAVKLGIARALLDYDETMRPELKAEGFLTRDARVKERKKYGRKKARRGFQFVKR